MFTEKNSIEVLILGKRIIVFDQDANKVATAKINRYEWEVTKGNE